MTPEVGSTAPPSGVQMIADAVATAGMTDAEAEARKTEESEVRKAFKQFDDDQKFDTGIRTQIRKDRNYASGETQANYPVSTNMIGSAIDVTTATLYARDPDISVRPAPQVDAPPDPITQMVPPQPERQTNVDFAKTLEFVLSYLWKKGKLKPRMRRVIRSVLSASHGWLKALPELVDEPNPLAQNSYNTLKDNVASVAAQIAALEAGQTLGGQQASVDDLKVQQKELETSMNALVDQLEVESCYGFTFDVVKPENVQVGTDVELLEEYLDSDSLTEIMYFPHDQLRQKFPGLKDTDLTAAEKYYRKAPVNANKGEGSAADDGGVGDLMARTWPNQGATEDLYTTTDGQEGSKAFAKVLEKWNKADNHIYTMICGVKVWARPKYKPRWASSRFYPYFYFSINEVDGQRCPQSLSSRGAKLQDEYASVRSSQRLTRQRSIPGTLVNATMLSDEELAKIQKGVIAEITPLKFTGAPNEADLSKMFAAKPVPNIDMRLYDTTSIVMDLERTFGIQEALQQVSTGDKTATEAEIEQTGYNTRTSTWRDTIETVLGDMAQFCAEVALQKIPTAVVQKIAGPAAYWPFGMALEDLTSLVQVNITAGTTGKPKSMGDREAWGVMAPQITLMQDAIFQLKQNPMTVPLATAKEEVLRETMRRFGDDSDLARFIPQAPALLPAVPGMPGAPGAPMPGEPPLPGGDPQGMLPLGEQPGLPAPPTEAVNPMQAGMAANGFLGAP